MVGHVVQMDELISFYEGAPDGPGEVRIHCTPATLARIIYHVKAAFIANYQFSETTVVEQATEAEPEPAA
eukprot:COSAG02_NODE_201_length_29473_cov_135.510213_17_plen_70_part_00